MTDADTAKHSIVIERVMPHPPERIWRALTQGPLIEAWLMKNDFQPVVGHSFNLRSNPMPQVCWDEAENVLDGEVFWGQDWIELLADALKSGSAPYRSQP